MDVELVKERVGNQWLITSPQLPGLYVADADLKQAEAAVPAAIRLLQEMKKKPQSARQPKKPAALA